MPRRAAAQNTAVALPPQPQLPNQRATLSPQLHLLRTSWKWAAFSQFFYTFARLLAAEDLTLTDLENDLVDGTSIYLPRIMQRLLYTLTQDRKLSADNWQTVLRRQYLRRDPDACPIGYEPLRTGFGSIQTSRFNSVSSAVPAPSNPDSNAAIEDNVDEQLKEEEEAQQQQEPEPEPEDFKPAEPLPNWLDLPMLTKLDSLHTLAEWQFQNTTRLRTTMRSDDEDASWRIEPIGYDAKGNAYWYMEDRLWIQRAPPKKPRPLKRARPKPKQNPNKKPRLNSSAPSQPKPSTSKATSNTGFRKGRAAKLNAKQKLSQQAQELAELNRQAALVPNSKRSSSKRTAPKTTGTRISSRLRGSTDTEWQQVPEEWLDSSARSSTKPKTGLECDDGDLSDLTELSEDEEEPNQTNGDDEEDHIKEESVQLSPSPEPEPSEPEPEPLPADFIEWETICVTLQEWEAVAEPFAKATHYAEKALYKILSQQIVPYVTNKLREIERKLKAEAAIVHRKRSSRIAIKESEREEARVQAQKKAEEEERQARARRIEARQRKDELAREKREADRERRRQEREAAANESNRSSPPIDVVGNGQMLVNGHKPVPQSQLQSSTVSNQSGTRTPDEWELDCEVCNAKGRNLDDKSPMISCGRCQKWQHIECHDAVARLSGRPVVDWNAIDFVCRHCRVAQASVARPHRLAKPPDSQPHLLPVNGQTPILPQPSPYPSQQLPFVPSPYSHPPANGHPYAHAQPYPQPYQQPYPPPQPTGYNTWPANPSQWQHPAMFSIGQFQSQSHTNNTPV